eukprot:2319343-Amphidinium_carterae.1
MPRIGHAILLAVIFLSMLLHLEAGRLACRPLDWRFFPLRLQRFLFDNTCSLLPAFLLYTAVAALHWTWSRVLEARVISVVSGSCS